MGLSAAWFYEGQLRLHRNWNWRISSLILCMNLSAQEVCSYATKSHPISVAVNVSTCGRLDGLALWFDLHLYDDITITTSPQGCHNMEQASCWEQAVYPVIHLEQGAR